MSLMIESHLKEGRQDLKEGQPLVHGVSITDACIGFAQTVPVLQAWARAVVQAVLQAVWLLNVQPLTRQPHKHVLHIVVVVNRA